MSGEEQVKGVFSSCRKGYHLFQAEVLDCVNELVVKAWMSGGGLQFDVDPVHRGEIEISSNHNVGAGVNCALG